MAQAVHVGIVALDNWMGGINYTHNLVRALAKLPREERPTITLFCSNKIDLFRELEPLVDRVVLFRPILNASPDRKLAYAARYVKTGICVSLLREAQPELAIAARRAGVEAIFSVTNPYTRFLPNAIAWIPDLQHRAIPELFAPHERKSRDYRFSRLLGDPSRHVVFSSHHAIEQARTCYGEPRAHTHILHFATVPEPSWFADPAPAMMRYQLAPGYLIACNQFFIHKDYPTLFRAVQLLARNGIKVNVVCTGLTYERRKPEYFPELQAEIGRMGIESQIRILGVIPRLDQVMLIRGASAVIQPSRFEGWSTVIEDARALNKRVIASDFPVHVEQNVPGSCFFRQGDAEDCARAIAEHLAGPQGDLVSNNNHEKLVTNFAQQFAGLVSEAIE